MRGLRHFVRRDFLSLWNMQCPVQRTGVLDRARNPMPGLTTRGTTLYRCAELKGCFVAPPPPAELIGLLSEPTPPPRAL